MSRIDKYDPVDGGFRAKLAFAPAVGVALGVGLDATGKVVAGAGATGVVGVICPSSVLAINDVIDVMTHGEIVDVTGLAAGTSYYGAAADGVVAAGAPAVGVNSAKIGYTVEAWRLIVRVETVQG